MSEPAVRFQNVSYTYATAETPAIREIDLEIAEGEYVAIMGLNGAGKTTLGLCINGVLPSMLGGERTGTVTVAGLDVDDYPVREMSKIIGMVFDNPEFQLSQSSVADEVALGLESVGMAPEDMDVAIAEALALVGLTGFEERSPFGLSGGQQQRLAIASVLAMKPRIVVLDEPTSNLDPIGKEEVFEMALRLNRENGMTVIMIEHEVEVMARYADRVIVLDDGRIVLNGPADEVLSQVAELAKYGLRAPDCARVVHQLQEDLGLRDVTVPVRIEPAALLLDELLSAR